MCVWGGGEGYSKIITSTIQIIEKLYLRDVGDEISSDQHLAGEILNDSLLFLGELVWLQNEG